MLVPFATQSYLMDAAPISAQRNVNLYAEKQPPDAKTPVAVFGSPGLVLFATVGTGPLRGAHVMGGLLYIVSGGTLYSVSSAGVAIALGGTISGSGVVSMDNNGTELVITNGVSGYLYSIDAGFQLIADPDFYPANTVTFVDQRFAFDRVGKNQWFISDSLDGASYDPLSLASAESRPDNVSAVVLISQLIAIMGDKSIELWQDVGAANFPFERVPGAVIERGLGAAYATAKADNAIFFLGDNRSFYRLNGTSPLRVSTHALERAWQKYAVISDAFSFSHFWNGHEFVYITFPSQPASFVYDVSSELWHERDSLDDNGNSYGRWRGNCHVSAYGREMIGDGFSGKLGYLDDTAFTEYGNTMIGTAVSPPLQAKDRKRMFMSRFELDVQSGVGLSSGQGSDPQVMLDWSDDGGRTFVDRQSWMSMGSIGAYQTRLKWTRLGESRDRIMRVSISDPVRRTIIAASADITSGL